MQTQFKPNGVLGLRFLLALKSSEAVFLLAPLRRHGMRNDCPVEQYHFHNSKPTVLYSSTLNGPTSTTRAPDKLTMMNGPFYQHATAAPSYPTVNDSAASLLSATWGTDTNIGMGPVDPVDGSGLAQGRSDPSPSTFFQSLISPSRR